MGNFLSGEIPTRATLSVLVAGPPGSGKTSLIRAAKKTIFADATGSSENDDKVCGYSSGVNLCCVVHFIELPSFFPLVFRKEPHFPSILITSVF
jgi:Cdc6-like AAA superfamily ATPase